MTQTSTSALPLGAMPEPALDADGRMIDDIACRSCGYALRGLSPVGACPECGTAIGRSIHGDLLRFSDPAWVERIARGVRLLVIGFMVSILGGVAIALIAAVVIAFNPGSSLYWMLSLTIAGYMLLVSVLNVAGYWLATTRDPGRDESERPLTARAIARWCIVASSITALLELPLNSVLARVIVLPGIDPDVRLIVDTALGILSQGCGATGMVALLIYAAGLARRLPDDKLARSCRFVAVGYGISGGVLLVGTALASLGESSPTGALAVAGGVVSMVGGLPGLLFGIWAIVLLFKFRTRLRIAASEARTTWALNAHPQQQRLQ